MAFLKRSKNNRQRLVVLGLDGVPYTLITRLLQRGDLPNLADLVTEGSLVRYNSTLPWVSSVAWSTYMTGVNPGKHGIYGFIDRQPGSYKTFIPTSRNIQSETLWEYLSKQGKHVVVMNVPVTYPPRQVNGILIAGFLSPNLEKAVYPPQISDKLQELGYRIDADPWLAHEDKVKLLDALDLTLDKRAQAMFYLMAHEEWDFFQCHIMETDRLHHFLWREMEEDHPTLAPRFYSFYHKLDQVIGQLRSRLDDDTELVVLSDHGFCGLQQEVYVNYWLAQQGWLKFETDQPRSLADISTQAVAYSLDPGRIYINLRGREPKGNVSPGAEYEALREEIASAALQLTDPTSGKRLFQAAFKREELYHGPCFEAAPDLILQPVDGFDPKGALSKDTLTHRGTVLVGMHTFDDAFLYIRGHRIKEASKTSPQGLSGSGKAWSILDVTPTVLQLLGLPIPSYMDGQPVI